MVLGEYHHEGDQAEGELYAVEPWANQRLAEQHQVDAEDGWNGMPGVLAANDGIHGMAVRNSADFVADRHRQIRLLMMQKAGGTVAVVSTYPPGVETTKAMIGLGFIAGSLIFNLIAAASLSFVLVLPQFSYVNDTVVRYVFLNGEGPELFKQTTKELPPCIAASFASVLWDAIASHIVVVVSLLLLPTCWLCGTTRWRFVRPCLMACATFVMFSAGYLTILEYNMGCNGDLRHYRTSAGFWNLLLGGCCCFLVTCGNFAQVSRYPLDRFPLRIARAREVG